MEEESNPRKRFRGDKRNRESRLRNKELKESTMEIKPNQIRLGNTFYLKTDIKPYPVVRIRLDSFSMLGVYKPIPIANYTTELGLNFSKGDPFISLDLNEHLWLISSKEGLYYPVLIKDAEFASEEPSMYHLRSVKYVHELENLFWALTGREIYEN